MSLTKQALNRYTRRLTLYFDGVDGDLNIDYYPNRMSPDWQRRTQRLTREANQRRRAREAERAAAEERGEEVPDDDDEDEEVLSLTIRMILEVIAGWDYYLEDGDAEPAPLTPEIMSTLGFSITSSILNGMMRQMNLDPTRSRSSAPPSTAKLWTPPATAPEPMGTGESFR